jgi:hypothetical protein
MRVRQIGTFVFDADTNIVVDANNQDVPGIGFRVNDLYDPQPFSVEIAFQRTTREQALNAVSTLARELHSYAQRRQDGRFAVAGGAVVWVEDATGGATLRSYLRDGSVTLLSVEAISTGVLARVRVTGSLINPFLDYTSMQNTLTSLLPYERRVVALSNLSDAYLYKHVFSILTNSNNSMSGLYNALLAIEELESATGTSRIQAINPATVTSGITTNNWNAGWATLTRAQFTSATSGTITYTIPTSVPHDIYRLFIEIFCPTTPPTNARYLVSWDEQPQIAETVVGDRSWYTPALFVRKDVVVTQILLNIQNVPTNTLVMPLVLVPTDGVSVWNVIAQPTLSYFHVLDLQSAAFRPFRVDPSGTVYGAPGFISSRYIAVFNGVMSTTITSASATLNISSRRIEPAAFA